MTYTTTAKLFSGTLISDFLNNQRKTIRNTIRSKDQNELLNVNVDQFAECLSAYHTLEFPLLDVKNITVSSYEGDIPASNFPSEFAIFDRHGNKILKRDIIVFHLPFQGDVAILELMPSTAILSGFPPIAIKSNEFLFEYINFYNKADVIQKTFEEDLRFFMTRYEILKLQFENFNSGLKDLIVQETNNRRDQLLAKNNFLASFNVPLKSNTNTSKMFSIPAPKLREKINITKPNSSKMGFIPEPALDYDNYQKILKIIDDVGRNFERMPSVYKGKNEESLRDHILMVLDPNFQYGSATGETFNKKGKTDILLRFDSSVVFVAECKFWAGEKNFQETIGQLLNYLTWRDSKTAVVFFVSNKEIIPVIEKINLITPLHNCYLKTIGKKAENWTEHVYHLPIDKNKEILLSILVFHLPNV